MKTKKTMKALLAAGLISLGAALSANAQTVYSINAVGFVNVSVPAGFSMIGDPLISTNNTLDSVIQGVPFGTTVYQWNGASFNVATYLGSWSPANHGITLNPGQGAFINVGSPITLTFVGEVPTAANSNINVPAGFAMVSSPVPQSGGLDTLSFPAQFGDTVYRFVSGAYQVSTYLGTWSPSTPTPAVGEAFWSYKGTAQAWNRNFSIAQ